MDSAPERKAVSTKMFMPQTKMLTGAKTPINDVSMLKEYMEKHGLTKMDVAKTIGVSHTQISRILNGLPISAKIGLRLREFYNIPLHKLNPAIWTPPAKREKVK